MTSSKRNNKEINKPANHETQNKISERDLSLSRNSVAYFR